MKRVSRIPSPAVPPPLGPQAQSVFLSLRWAWYALSVFVPLAGIFVALLLYDQDSREERRVGRTCLLVSFLLWIVLPIVLLAAAVLVGAVAVLALISDLMPVY